MEADSALDKFMSGRQTPDHRVWRRECVHSALRAQGGPGQQGWESGRPGVHGRLRRAESGRIEELACEEEECVVLHEQPSCMILIFVSFFI